MNSSGWKEYMGYEVNVGHWMVWTIRRGVSIRVIHVFNTNLGFGSTRPVIFASMGPNLKIRCKQLKYFFKK